MNKPFFFNKIFSVSAFLLILSISNFAQTVTSAPPVQEKLLNGLKVLSWRTPQADKVSVRIRIHSGASFDPQGKEGLMAVLAENIFPNQAARDFFAEDLGGSFEIIKNHDFIQINTTGNSEEFLTILQTLSNAFTNFSVDKETTAKLKTLQIEKVKELEKNPAYIADQIAAKRLLGTFPYGRATEGTQESIQKIDFADLIYAKERFLTADNATIAISGDVKSDFAFRAVKRYFGGWQKSENRIPSSFRQPDEPDTKHFESTINGSEEMTEVRYALRGLARNDADFAASEVLTKILQNRLQKQQAGNAFVRHEEHILPGLLILGYSTKSAPTTDSGNGDKTKSVAALLLTQNITNEEFTKAKTDFLSDHKTKNQADLWFDVETFKLTSVTDESKAFEAVTQADVQRVAEKLSKNPVVMISVTEKTTETKTN
ncbi:MAG: insulinase family protein [Pyrinomonadaceae bacterium]|nr:insulinase family protein [Pyrinomonadaceae bacterium]